MTLIIETRYWIKKNGEIKKINPREYFKVLENDGLIVEIREGKKKIKSVVIEKGHHKEKLPLRGKIDRITLNKKQIKSLIKILEENVLKYEWRL